MNQGDIRLIILGDTAMLVHVSWGTAPDTATLYTRYKSF
jgi:hypothetical protein